MVACMNIWKNGYIYLTNQFKFKFFLINYLVISKNTFYVIQQCSIQ